MQRRLLQLHHKEIHEAHQRQTEKKTWKIMYFPFVKVYVNGFKSGILHRATGYIEQSIFHTNSWFWF